MQVRDITNKDQQKAARAFTDVYEIRKAWTDLNRPVDLLGRVRQPGGADLMVVADADAGDNPDVWLVPGDGVTIPFTPEKYEKRPLAEVDDVVEEGPTRYDRAWDIVQEYRGGL